MQVSPIVKKKKFENLLLKIVMEIVMIQNLVFVRLKILLQNIFHVFQIPIKMNNFTTVTIVQLHLLIKGTLIDI